MAKFLVLTCLLLTLVSCDSSECQNQDPQNNNEQSAACPVEPQPSEPLPIPDHGEVPTEALIFDVSASLTNFEREDEDKIYKAFEIIKKVVATKEFRNRILSFTYQGKREFVDNEGMSNEEIYQSIIDGSEKLRPEIDHAMNLELQLYYSWRNTVGYTYPNVMRIYLNTKYFDRYTPAEVAGNVFHEWTHKLGFGHASSYSEARNSSVPYAVGYIMKELGKNYE